MNLCALFEIVLFKKGTEVFQFKSEKFRVRIPAVAPTRAKISFVSKKKIEPEKVWKQLMRLAFSQTHLNCFDNMVPVAGVEPATYR